MLTSITQCCENGLNRLCENPLGAIAGGTVAFSLPVVAFSFLVDGNNDSPPYTHAGIVMGAALLTVPWVLFGATLGSRLATKCNNKIQRYIQGERSDPSNLNNICVVHRDEIIINHDDHMYDSISNIPESTNSNGNTQDNKGEKNCPDNNCTPLLPNISKKDEDSTETTSVNISDSKVVFHKNMNPEFFIEDENN